MKSPSLLLLLGLLATPVLPAQSAATPAAATPTPVNQVFQFMFSSDFTWASGTTGKSTSYLWIPENCRTLRGLLILGSNVPEHKLVGHPAIRKVCEANDFGIVWSTPSFLNAKELPKTMEFCQQQLDGLAKVSGYAEVATVPWLPMGESGHLKLVQGMLDEKPERTLAGVLLKDTNLPSKNQVSPVLAVQGTGYEWEQDKSDIRSAWSAVGLKKYEGLLVRRAQNPQWPISLVFDGHSGHFDCDERLIAYIARYVDLAIKARLPADGSGKLRPVELTKGFAADLPLPGHEGKPVVPESGKSGLGWYFDAAQAKEAQAMAAINWKAETQLPAYVDDQGKDLPHNFNGITNIKTATMEADGLTFTVRGRLLDAIPEGFVGASEKLAKTPGTPSVEWLSGPIEPRGGGRFRIALDRTWMGGTATYVGLRQPATATVRGIIQPAGIELRSLRIMDGKPQKIVFAPITDVKAGIPSVPLVATSDAGLPVQFFVQAGPAIVRDGKVVFTAIPPRSQFPITVTVVAWQWGRASEPKVKTAELVTQTFRLLAP